MMYRLAANGEEANGRALKSRLQFKTRLCSYTVHNTQYDRLSQQQLSFLLYYAELLCKLQLIQRFTLTIMRREGSFVGTDLLAEENKTNKKALLSQR